MVASCENIPGKQIVGIGYSKADKDYGWTPPVLQLMKIKADLEKRLELLKEIK